MRLPYIFATSLLCLGTLTASAADAAPKIEETARRIFKANADSVITVRATVALTMSAGDSPSQSRDQTVEEFGTVVTADGLVVVAASAIDPATAADGRTVNMRGNQVKLSVTSEVKEARFIMPDGTEVPATVVFKDRDLNLAFLAPEAGADEAKDAKFVPISTASIQKLGVLDEVVVLSRLDKAMGRTACVECDAVRAALDKPRAYYSIHVNLTGLPVFGVSGQFAGFTTTRFGSSGDNGGISMSPVVLPAAEVVKSLEQAKAKRASAPASKPAPAAKPAEEKK
jgi:S1-C subfamily serine protease